MKLESGSGCGYRPFARRDLLRRPLVDGSQGRFVQTAGALVLRQRRCCGWALCWLVSILSPQGRWERLLACLLGFVMARLIVTRLSTGGQPCALVPMR